jgi:hypothetical protein
MAKSKEDPGDEQERLFNEGKLGIAAKRRMQVQQKQGRVASLSLGVGIAILVLTAVLVVLSVILLTRTN